MSVSVICERYHTATAPYSGPPTKKRPRAARGAVFKAGTAPGLVLHFDRHHRPAIRTDGRR